MVQWATFDPCTCFSESDSEQYANFEFCEKIHIYNHLHWSIDLQSQAICVDKNNLKKSLEDNTSECASNDIELVIVKCLEYDKISLNWWFFTKILDDDLKCIMISRNMKKN